MSAQPNHLPLRDPSWWTEDQSRRWAHALKNLRKDWEQDSDTIRSSHVVEREKIDGDKFHPTFPQNKLRGNIPISIQGGDTTGPIGKEDTTGVLGKEAVVLQGGISDLQGRILESGFDGGSLAYQGQRRAYDPGIHDPASESGLEDAQRPAWSDIEEPARYGYGAALHYTDEWDTRFEPSLRKEWTELDALRSWEEVRTSVRLGWDRARLFKED